MHYFKISKVHFGLIAKGNLCLIIGKLARSYTPAGQVAKYLVLGSKLHVFLQYNKGLVRGRIGHILPTLQQYISVFGCIVPNLKLAD